MCVTVVNGLCDPVWICMVFLVCLASVMRWDVMWVVLLIIVLYLLCNLLWIIIYMCTRSLLGRSGGTEKSEERNRAVTTYIFLAGHPDNLTITSHRDRSFSLLNRERKWELTILSFIWTALVLHNGENSLFVYYRVHINRYYECQFGNTDFRWWIVIFHRILRSLQTIWFNYDIIGKASSQPFTSHLYICNHMLRVNKQHLWVVTIEYNSMYMTR